MTREILWTPLSASTLATLEEEFFDLLWRCDSTSLTRRDAATRELTRRFWEFEPIWSDRAPLSKDTTEARDGARLFPSNQ